MCVRLHILIVLRHYDDGRRWGRLEVAEYRFHNLIAGEELCVFIVLSCGQQPLGRRRDTE